MVMLIIFTLSVSELEFSVQVPVLQVVNKSRELCIKTELSQSLLLCLSL